MKKWKMSFCFLFAGLLLSTLSCKHDEPKKPSIEAQVFKPGNIEYGKKVGIAYILKRDSVLIIGAETKGLYIGIGPGYIDDALYIYYQRISKQFAADAYKAHIIKPIFPFGSYVEDGDTREPFHAAIFLDIDGEIKPVKDRLYVFYGPYAVVYKIVGDSIHTYKLLTIDFYKDPNYKKKILNEKGDINVFVPFS